MYYVLVVTMPPMKGEVHLHLRILERRYIKVSCVRNSIIIKIVAPIKIALNPGTYLSLIITQIILKQKSVITTKLNVFVG